MVVQILADATSFIALVYRYRSANLSKSEGELQGYLLAAYALSLLYTAAYHGYSTFGGQDAATWTVWAWIFYLLFIGGFWCRALLHQVEGKADAISALKRLSVIITVSLAVAHGIHLSDLVRYENVDVVRRGVYGISGVVEAALAAVLCVSAMMFRKFSWIQLLALVQLALIQLDLVFCSVEFNDKATGFVSWPWETAWAACQWVAAWVIVQKLGDLKPFVGEDDLHPPRNTLRGPVSTVAICAGALLGTLTFFVTSRSSWTSEPFLRGEGVALSVFMFAGFMVFIVPQLVFDDGKPSALERIVNNIFLGDIAVGDIIKGNTGVVVTRGAAVTHSTIDQQWNQAQDTAAVERLAAELASLRSELRRGADGSLEQDAEIGVVAAAEAAARAGDGGKAIEALKSAGKWTLDVAEKIGVSVASSAIKSALGIP